MFNITMPPGGQTTDQSLIAGWHKKVGDPVKRGDVLFEIETDKATLEVESYCEGILRAMLYQEGDLVTTGEVVAYVGSPEEALPDQPTAETLSEPDQVDDDPAEEEYRPIIPAMPVTNALASPKAKKAARNHGVDLAVLPISEKAIKYQDVMASVSSAVPVKEVTDYEVIALTQMRRTIARRMSESVSTAPHYTVSMDIDMTACMALRSRINNYLAGQSKVAYHDLLMKCTAKAIEAFPLINASFKEEEIRRYKTVNIGLAVALDSGLVVPVVKDVDSKSLTQIAGENREHILEAQQGNLKQEEMSGGTITISNLGMFGVDHFTAVINQPESCILAVGAIIEKPVALDGQVVLRPMMNITASFDHRLIDGAVGARFLRKVRELMEQPELLLV